MSLGSLQFYNLENIMKKLPLYTLAGLTLALNPLQAYDKDLETLYPESTMLYGRVDDITRLSKIDKDHPIANLLNNEAFKQFVFGRADKDKTELQNEAIDFLTKHCLERASFGLLNVGIGKANNETTNAQDSQQVKIALNLSQLSGGVTIDCTATQEELDTFLKFIKENSDEIKDVVSGEFEGVTYSTLEMNMKVVEKGASAPQKRQSRDVAFIALTDELLIITNKERELKDFIGKVIAPNKNKTLADNPKYLDVADKLQKYDLSAFARLDQVYKILIEDEETSLLNYLDSQPQLKAFVSTDAIKKDLHLDAFDSAFWGAKLTDEGGELKSGFSVVSKEGVANMFQYDKNIPEIPEYAFEGFTSMSVSSYDFGANFNQMEKMIGKISPMGFMMAKGQFGDAYAMTKTNLFDNVDPYFVTLSGHIDPELQTKRASSKVFVFKVKNDNLVHELVAKMQKDKLLKGVSTEMFMDEKVYKMPVKNGVTYYAAIVKNLLVVTQTSEDAMWRHVISQIKKPGKTITSHKALMDMWDTMEKEEVESSYTDIGQMIMDGYFEQQKLMAIMDESAVDMPDVKGLNYSLVSKFYQEENFWYSVMKLKDYSPHQK